MDPFHSPHPITETRELQQRDGFEQLCRIRTDGRPPPAFHSLSSTASSGDSVRSFVHENELLLPTTPPRSVGTAVQRREDVYRALEEFAANNVDENDVEMMRKAERYKRRMDPFRNNYIDLSCGSTASSSSSPSRSPLGMSAYTSASPITAGGRGRRGLSPLLGTVHNHVLAPLLPPPLPPLLYPPLYLGRLPEENVEEEEEKGDGSDTAGPLRVFCIGSMESASVLNSSVTDPTDDPSQSQSHSQVLPALHSNVNPEQGRRDQSTNVTPIQPQYGQVSGVGSKADGNGIQDATARQGHCRPPPPPPRRVPLEANRYDPGRPLPPQPPASRRTDSPVFAREPAGTTPGTHSPQVSEAPSHDHRNAFLATMRAIQTKRSDRGDIE